MVGQFTYDSGVCSHCGVLLALGFGQWLARECSWLSAPCAIAFDQRL